MMFDWKQRLYAFLLRRILGPWLDEESIQQLHESIELVSLQEGKLVLTHVGLNTEYLTQKLHHRSNKNKKGHRHSSHHGSMSIGQARIERLEITLSLQEQQQTSSSSRAESAENGYAEESSSSNSQQQSQQQTRSSLAWRTLKLGTTMATLSEATSTSTPSVALVVNVLVEGVCIEVEPNNHDDDDDDDDAAADDSSTSKDEENGGTNSATTPQVAAPKGMLSSYMEAALSSLRLTVKVNRLTIRTWSKAFNTGNSGQQEQHQQQQQQQDWIELVVKSISYHDVNRHHHHPGNESTTNANTAVATANGDGSDAAAAAAASAALEHSQQQTSLYETVMHKALDITRISISTGRGNSSGSSDSGDLTTTATTTASSPVALVEGTSTIRVRAIQYCHPSSQQQSPTSKQSPTSLSLPPQLQQDVELTVGQKVNFLFNQPALLQIQRVVQSYRSEPAPTEQHHQHHHHNHVPPRIIHSSTNGGHHDHHQQQHQQQHGHQQQQQLNGNTSVDTDTADLKTIEGIMQQYHQARLLAERNPVRGGILLPSESTGTLDAFFDANESSVHRYSTMLLHQQQSTILPPTLTEEKDDNDDDARPGMDFVHSKIKCHLVGLSAKVVLIADKDLMATYSASSSSSSAIPVWRQQQQRLLQPDEYILLTLTDLNLSSSQSLRTSTYTLGITHVEIEDSLLVVPSTDRASNSTPPPLPRAEIGSILSFTTIHENDEENGGGGGEHNTNMVLCQAPVLSMDITTTRSSSSSEKVQLDLSLEPMQLTIRLAVASKLSRMLSEITTLERKRRSHDDMDDEYSEMENYMGNRETKSPEQHEQSHYRQETTKTAAVATSATRPPITNNLRARISCPSVDFLLPVSTETIHHDWSALYKRCGYHGSSANNASTRPCLGFHFDSPLIQMGAGVGKKNRPQDLPVIDPTLVISSQHVIFFALIPPRLSSVAAQRQRLLPRQVDILVLAGRSTVDPFSISVYRNLLHEQKQSSDEKESSLDNVATRAFPMTPPISSFKARQDDDEEDDVDASCSSVGGDHDVPVATRQEMRGSDPQPRMVEETASSNCVVEIRIPDLSCDVSALELSAIQDMINGIHSSSISQSNTSPASGHAEIAESSSTTTPTSLVERMSISCACDSIALAIRETPNISLTANATHQSDDEACMFTYIVRADTLRAHTLLENGKSFRHVRLLVHELDFFEMQDDESALLQPQVCQPTTAEGRSNALAQRIRQSSFSASVTPILYRSHLFSPISRQSPCILIDILDTTKMLAGTSDCAFVERKVYATLYDVTYRYDFDSRWISILQSIFKKPENGTATGTCELSVHDVPAKDSLTRVFFSITDCNIDYSSCPRFRTASRLIARFGDLRITSNILSPAPSVQAFKLSLADFSIYLCNSRHPYNFENSRLLDADALLRSGQVEHSHRDSVTCLRAMNYRTIVLLDAADAVIAIANGQPKKPTDPWVKTTLSLGEVGIFACKDSFHLFLQSIGELSAEATALNNQAFDELKREPPFIRPLSQQAAQPRANGIRKGPIRPSVVETTLSIQRQHDFLLDGYDWTTVAQGGSTPLGIPPGEDQSARWYGENGSLTAEPPHARTDVPAPTNSLAEKKDPTSGVHFIPHHFPVHQATDPLVDGDMSAAKYAGTSKSPRVQSRLVVQNMRIKARFFDGYDWPETLNRKLRNIDRHRSFIIDQPDKQTESGDKDKNKVHGEEKKQGDRKASLMANLLDGPCEKNDTFQDTPLPEERGARLKEQADLLRLARRTDKYIQISASGITVRSDSLAKGDDHILASCLYIKAQDFFMAETISGNKPVKMIGEWFNEVEHPRDTKSGLVFIKMVTWHAAKRITDDNKIASDECKATVKLLPLRCVLDQRAIRFTSSFFQSPTNSNDGENEPGPALPAGLHAIPPPLFRLFRIRPFRLKVDYKPEKLDAQALRNGQIVELINLSPLDGMILQLQQVQAVEKVGFGAVIGEAVGCWIRDICSTQLLKFLANSRPLEPITNVGGGISDLIVLPWEAFQNGESVKKAMRSGARSFARSLAYETFTISSGLTEFVAAKTAAATCFDPLYNNTTSTNGSGGHGGGGGGGYSNGHHGHGGMLLPMRPLETPRGISDIGPHALESLSRGIATANLKIVVIPYREYRRSGTTGAVRSVLKGIPVAIAAPASGAVEALSFTLLGVRNSLRPDIRKEEEVSQRGLRLDGS